MDEKELNDPLNNVPLIKGNPEIGVYHCEYIDTLKCSGIPPDTAHLPADRQRGKIMSHS